MVKAEVKTPNKRKSLLGGTPAKKIKVENGESKPLTLTIKREKFSPKAQTPKNKQSPFGKKPNQKNKQTKPNQDSVADVKDVKPFAGTKQLNQGKGAKKQNKPKAASDEQAAQTKKRRRGLFTTLITEVRSKEGSKDAELLKKLDEKIETISSRGELSKTAKRKLAVLQKLRIVCEEGSAAAAVKSKATKEAARKETQKKPKPAAQASQPKKKLIKAAPLKKEEEDDEEDTDEEEEEENSEEEGDEESDEVEGEEDDDDDEEEDEADSDDDEAEDNEGDDSDEEEEPAPKGRLEPAVKKVKTSSNSNPNERNRKHLDLKDLKNKEIVKTGQKRFVLFVGNIPYDTTKQDLIAHFLKVGDIAHIRIPLKKGSNKPRGFAYVEVKNETAYEKCLSMHHTQLKGRRINVLYTQGGKKKGDDKKKEIKAKNMKLHALRREGKLAGSVKETQKRSFRRK